MAPAPRTAGEVSPARRCAYAVLVRVFEHGAYADEALRAQAQSQSLDARERALAMRLAYGAIQRRATLDHLIGGLAERDVGRIDAPLMEVLRLGLYELLYLQGSPEYATVAQAVELAKREARAGHGMVNAILRRAAREGPAALLGPLGDGTPEQAALKHSHPEWVARMWWRTLGPEQALALMAADNEPSEVALRANTLVGEPAELAARLPVASHGDPELPEALVLEEPFDLYGSPLWARGALIAQSRAAMLVARTLAPEPGERVLDLCAAPGGKATHLAALMQGRGELVAVERDRRRAGVLARTAERMGAGNVRVEVADAARPREEAAFDRVLVDPPVQRPGDVAGAARPALAHAGGLDRGAGGRPAGDPRGRSPRAPSGWGACLLYVHDLSG